MSPLGARALLGVPAGELTSLDFEGADVLGPLAAQISERLQDAADWPRRFEILNELLLDRALARADAAGTAPGAVPGISREVRYAWLALLRSGGRVGVAQLAAQGGYYDQAHLDREFGALAGCAPTAWLAQEFRSVQAAPDQLVPG